MDNKNSGKSLLITLFLAIIVISSIVTAIYRCPSLKDHNNLKCDVCGEFALSVYDRNGTYYELCDRHYRLWKMKY